MKKKVKNITPENQPVNHYYWLSLWVVILAFVIPLGLQAMGLLTGPWLATACWFAVTIALSHLIWINPLIKNNVKTKAFLILCLVFGFGYLSHLSFVHAPIKNLPDIKPATPQLPFYIPVTTIVKEIVNNSSQTIENENFKGISVWLRDNKPAVAFTLGDNPPTIQFWFPIGIKNNTDEKRTIELKVDYLKEQFLPPLWKFHQMIYFSESRDLSGAVTTPESPFQLPPFDPQQEDLFYIVLAFETGESKDGSYYDRLTDLGDQAFIRASVVSDKNEKNEVQGDFVLRETVLQTFKEKLPGTMKEWEKP